MRGHEHGRAQLVDAQQELDDLPAMRGQGSRWARRR
jgi:hypothetical protein